MNDMGKRPKYILLMEQMKRDIRNGVIKPGDKLPSENKMSEEYNVSRHTVRKALAILENEGLVVPEHGKGTFLSDKRGDSIQSRIIAVVTTYISDYIFPRVIKGIDNVLNENGYTIMLKNTSNSQVIEQRCLEDVIAKNIDGLIIEPSKSEIYCRNEEQYEELDSLGIPYVFIQGQYMGMENKPSITMDDMDGAYQLTRYMIELGHKNIYGIFKADDTQGNERHKGYVKALNEAHMEYDPDKVIWFHTEDRKIKPVVAVKHIVKHGKVIDGIVCYNDEIALLVYRTLSEIGVKVPEDISITGYDNSFIAENGPIKLTTIAHPKELIGEYAAKLLMEKLHNVNDEDSKVKRKIKAEIIIRDSCLDRRSK